MGIKYQLRLTLVLLSCMHFSCNSTTGLYRVFTSKKASLMYIYDSNIRTNKLDRTITINKPVITDERFSQAGTLTKMEGYVIPLIVYNEWKSIHNFQIGKSVIEEDIPWFVQNSFLKESIRSGSFLVDTVSRPGHLTLELEIDSLGASGLHVQQGFLFYGLFIYVSSATEHAGPGIAYSQFHYILRRDDKILLEDRVNSRKSTQPLISRHKSTKSLRLEYTTNLVEALSLTFKNNIEIITSDLNIFLNLKKDELD